MCVCIFVCMYICCHRPVFSAQCIDTTVGSAVQSRYMFMSQIMICRHVSMMYLVKVASPTFSIFTAAWSNFHCFVTMADT